MRIKVINKDKVKNKFALEAIKEYDKRLGKYCKIELKTATNVEKEIKGKSYIIKIDRAGEPISSEQLAAKLSSLGIEGNSHVAIVVDEGFNENKVDFLLKLSNMDIGEDLMLTILYEQIYRAYRIINNEPYHK